MIKNWLVTGDCHGDFTRFYEYKTKRILPQEIAFIILGDAGFNFFLNETDNIKKEYVNQLGYRIYCVRGNHEARPQSILNMKLIYDEDVDGQVWFQEKYPNIRYFMDYGEYWINHNHILVIGGAYSVDKYYRLYRKGLTEEDNNPKITGWFIDEQLSKDEMKAAEFMYQYESFDFVFSHTCPFSFRPTDLFLNCIDQSKVDNSMELWLDKIKDKINWSIWLFGHFHKDRLERPYVEQFYTDIENLNDIKKRWEKYTDTGETLFLDTSPNFYM